MTDVPDRPWTAAHAPRRILAIRLQALGDVVATLPYLQALRRALGCVEIDFLTRRAVANVPANLVLFRRVYWIGGRRRFRYQLLSALLLQPLLLLNKYDVVVDLQNNRLSRFVRRSLRSTAWSSFDRFSPLHAGERTRRTIEDAGFPLPRVTAGLVLKEGNRGLQVLRHTGMAAERELVVLSPGGAFPTRNWPLDRYADFARLWRAAEARTVRAPRSSLAQGEGGSAAGAARQRPSKPGWPDDSVPGSGHCAGRAARNLGGLRADAHGLGLRRSDSGPVRFEPARLVGAARPSLSMSSFR